MDFLNVIVFNFPTVDFFTFESD